MPDASIAATAGYAGPGSIRSNVNPYPSTLASWVEVHSMRIST